MLKSPLLQWVNHFAPAMVSQVRNQFFSRTLSWYVIILLRLGKPIWIYFCINISSGTYTQSDLSASSLLDKQYIRFCVLVT